jgi:hypothetical protein
MYKRNYIQISYQLWTQWIENNFTFMHFLKIARAHTHTHSLPLLFLTTTTTVRQNNINITVFSKYQPNKSKEDKNVTTIPNQGLIPTSVRLSVPNYNIVKIWCCVKGLLHVYLSCCFLTISASHCADRTKYNLHRRRLPRVSLNIRKENKTIWTCQKLFKPVT